MSLPQFKLHRPRTVEEAISLLDDCGQHAGEGPFDSRSGQVRAIRIVAGGTDLIPSLQQKLFEPQHVLDIRRRSSSSRSTYSISVTSPNSKGSGKPKRAPRSVHSLRSPKSSIPIFCGNITQCWRKPQKPSLRPSSAIWAQLAAIFVWTRVVSGTTSRSPGVNPADSASRKMETSATLPREGQSAGRRSRPTRLLRSCA